MPGKTQSIVLGGVVAAVLGALAAILNIPVLSNCLGCLAYLAAGLIAVWHYVETYTLTISGGTGAGMGAGAGAVAGIVGALISFVLQAIGLVPSFSQGIDQAISQGQLPADQAETVRAVFESPFFYVGIIVFALIIGAIMGAIGGAIGASVFKRGGDAPGGGSAGGDSGGPRAPEGDRPQPGGPQARSTPPTDTETRERETTSYSPSSGEEEPATRQA